MGYRLTLELRIKRGLRLIAKGLKGPGDSSPFRLLSNMTGCVGNITIERFLIAPGRRFFFLLVYLRRGGP